MSLEERDPYTGHMTTGHDWNGIKELNTPVPRVLLFFLALAFVFSVIYWVLMPAWPGINNYTRGTLGADQQADIAKQQTAAKAQQANWTDALEKSSFEDIKNDERLMTIVRESGPALFIDNCAMCHGDAGQGSLNFPRLNDASWLWGPEPEQILKTLRYGINSGHASSRVANMPAFGRDGTLDSESINHLVLYVQSLSNSKIGDGSLVTQLTAVQNGKANFSTYCVACHGVDGTGNTALGAPDLTDNFWLYGSDEKALQQTLYQGRAGVMPAWERRLSTAQLRILTLYVLQLSQKNATSTGNNSNSEDAPGPELNAGANK